MEGAPHISPELHNDDIDQPEGDVERIGDERRSELAVETGRLTIINPLHDDDSSNDEGVS